MMQKNGKRTSCDALVMPKVVLSSHSNGSFTIIRYQAQTWEFRVDSENHYVQVRAECRQWCIYPGIEIHGQRQPKSETESTNGSTKWSKTKTKTKLARNPSGIVFNFAHIWVIQEMDVIVKWTFYEFNVTTCPWCVSIVNAAMDTTIMYAPP